MFKDSPIFFINKDGHSNSLTRSNSDERYHIFSHVQSRRRKQARQNAKVDPWAKYALTFESGKSTSASRCIRAERTPTTPESNRNLHKEQQIRLTSTYPTHNGSDPFHCTSVGLDASSHSTIRFALSSFAKESFLAEAYGPRSRVRERTSMRHDEMMQQRLQRCVDNEMLMYSTLAYGSTSMAWMYGRLETGRPPEYFNGKSLQAIRGNLSSTSPKPDTWLLLSVYAMAITDMWNGIPSMWGKCPTRLAQVDDQRLQSSRTHLKALNALVEQAGGWTAVDSYVLESAILVDKYLSCLEMKPTVIPLIWDPGPLPPTMHRIEKATLDYKVAGHNFLKLNIDPNLRDVIRDVISFVHAAQGLWAFEDVFLTAADEGWLFKRLNALTYRLWLLELPTKPAGFENCIRHTLLLFLSSTTHYLGGHMGAGTRVRNVKLVWIEFPLWPKSMDPGLYFWCVCTAAMTPWPCEEREWFRVKARELTDEVPREGLVEYIKARLLRYLYLPDRQGEELESLVRWLRPTEDTEE